MDFINPSLENIDTLKEYLGSLNIRNCVFGIANNILWSRLYETVYTIVDDMMVFVGKEEGHPSSVLQRAAPPHQRAGNAEDPG